MKKIRLLFTLLAVSIGALQSAWARTAPTLPETTTLESGKTYYLYNANSDRFLYQNGETPEIVQGRATSVIITQTADKTYMLQFSNNNRYIWTSGGDLSTQTGIDRDVYFRIETTEGGYIIRRNRNYNENQYVGYNGNTRANSDVGSDGNILWQLIAADLKNEVDMYTAKTHLNSALNIAETTNYEVSDYNDIYEDATQTASQIASAADRLYEGINISGRMRMSWSDYPILFTFHNSGWKTYDNEYDSPYIKDGGRAAISATVNVDENATMVYDAQNLWNKVYLDDELVAYNNNGSAINGGNNHYVEMTPGKHVVKWVFENDGSRDASGYLYNVGIEKTPTITVSLLEPGSLGTEVLKNTDHIQNVRKLVISGPMNSDDWARIMMMTSLFTLDLTDAEITEIPESQLSYDSHRNNLYFFHEVKLPKTLKVGRFVFNPSNPSEPSPSTLKPKHNLTATCNEGGSISWTSQRLQEGQSITLTAYVNDGYSFLGWYLNGELYTRLTQFSYTVTTETVQDFEARFEFTPDNPAEPGTPTTTKHAFFLMNKVTKPGATLKFPIYLSAVRPLGDMTFQLEFPEVLIPDFETVEMSERATSYSVSYTKIDATNYIFTLTGSTVPAGNAALLVFTISVAEDIETAQNYPVKINQVSVTEEDGSTITASTRNGRISVYKLGDTNGDDVVNALDVLNMAKVAVNKETEVFIEEVSDINGDDGINALDVLGVVKIAVNQ